MMYVLRESGYGVFKFLSLCCSFFSFSWMCDLIVLSGRFVFVLIFVCVRLFKYVFFIIFCWSGLRFVNV